MMKKLFKTVHVYLALIMAFSAPVHASQNTDSAIFAGGCFWCMEADFEELPGVHDVISGYSGGKSKNPNYDNFAAGGHIEAVKVSYDPSIITYSQLLDHFWRHIDPTDAGGQFCDRGREYSTAIFTKDKNQKTLAEQSKATLEKSAVLDDKVVTPVLEASFFYPAEDFHQDYYKTRAFRYMFYRYRCGRDDRLDQLWADVTFPISVPETTANFSKPSDAELKQRLTPLQYKVTQHDGTEPAFHNKYWDNKQEGIYVDIVSGEPLFSSLDKYKSGTGWPSFTRPLEPDNIITKEDKSWFMVRTEVRSKHADSHLGHVFDDGPAPTGLRYCMNSASMRFIAKEDLAKEGYAEYAELFEN